MQSRFSSRWLLVSLALLLSSAALAAGKPEDELAATIKAALGKSFVTDWEGVEKLMLVKWAPLPPTELKNCMPDGSCYTRQGAAAIGGRKLVVIAAGARTIVSNIYIRNMTAPFGEDAVVGALKGAAFSTELARCPVKGSAGGTNWYRLRSATTNPGILSIQTSCNGRPCEGYVISQGEDLPQLQPNQLRMYSEQCSGEIAERKPVSAKLPHEELAQTLINMIPLLTRPAILDWKSLAGIETAIKWNPGNPQKVDRSILGDPNPMMQSGSVSFGGRRFSAVASGTPDHVKAIFFEEGGLHPRGEHLLGVIYNLGFQVKLARCGPVYTESTNNWYTLTSANTRPVLLQQSIRYDGNQVQDSYALRLDGTLPKRDPRDRDPGVGGCR